MSDGEEARLAELRVQLADLCATHLTPGAGALVQELARPAVRLRHSDSARRSRLGGPALLPPGTLWPSWGGKPLSLVAMIDLAELQGFVTDVSLPAHGLLNFFYEAEEQDAWGFDPAHRQGWRVIPGNLADAVTLVAPEGATAFPAIGLDVEQLLTIPGWEEPDVEAVVPPYRQRPANKFQEIRARRVSDRESALREGYRALQDAWDTATNHQPSPHHQIGGWPCLVQGPFWRECDVVSQGLPMGTGEQFRDPRVLALPDNSSDWRLLLQLDTDDDAGWMWGDVGTLYFAVRDSVPPPVNGQLAVPAGGQ